VNAPLAVLKFFSWCYAKGGKIAKALDYVPMSDNVVSDVLNPCRRPYSAAPPCTTREYNAMGIRSMHGAIFR
jgi:hypothetical protein